MNQLSLPVAHRLFPFIVKGKKLNVVPELLFIGIKLIWIYVLNKIFYLLRWFRIFFPGAIVVALAYSAHQGYASPPVHVSAAGAAIISAALTAQYVILAISILFFVLAKFLRVPWKIHEYRLVLGFGISSLAVAFAGTVRSAFGTRFEFLSEMLPAVAYIVSLVVWLSAALHAERSNDQPALRFSPEHAVSDLRRQLLAIRSFLRKE